MSWNWQVAKNRHRPTLQAMLRIDILYRVIPYQERINFESLAQPLRPFPSVLVASYETSFPLGYKASCWPHRESGLWRPLDTPAIGAASRSVAMGVANRLRLRGYAASFIVGATLMARAVPSTPSGQTPACKYWTSGTTPRGNPTAAAARRPATQPDHANQVTSSPDRFSLS